jgi:hypothetical protein
MRAAMIHGPGEVRIDEVPRPLSSTPPALSDA